MLECIKDNKRETGKEMHPYQGATRGEDSFDRSATSSTAATARGIDPLLFLPAIAEPDPNHLFFHIELVSDHCDLFRGRFLVLLEEGKKPEMPCEHCGNCDIHLLGTVSCPISMYCIWVVACSLSLQCNLNAQTESKIT